MSEKTGDTRRRLLQQAALDSLRTWKYEPGYLDENPVSVKTSITVNFRLH